MEDNDLLVLENIHSPVENEFVAWAQWIFGTLQMKI